MSWDQYYEKNLGRSLRPLYLQAIQFVPSSAKQAADLGCGIGTEVQDMLKRGFEVHAIDQEAKAIQLVQESVKENSNRLRAHHSSLEDWKIWPEVDFLFAYHSFPFCSPASFEAVVNKSLSSVNSDGIFASSFFGPEDAWAQAGRVVGITAGEVKLKLNDFDILHFEEIKKLGPTALSGDKMWHVIEVIARRK